MNPDRLAQEMLESIRTATDEDFDAVWDEMVKEGIIDEDGVVLKRFPEPPDWLTGRNGHPKSEAPIKPIKKARKPRKRS